MLTAFIIMFRETLEAALIISIISGFLIKTDHKNHLKQVAGGSAAGIVASLIGAFLFSRFADGFSGRREELFEGITMIVGALLLSSMILWMMNRRNITVDIERQVSKNVSSTFGAGLFFLTFVSILREGVESVIFLAALRYADSQNTVPGAIFGISAAIILGFLLFIGSLKINMKRLFTVTNILLILFAAGLFAQGIHELQEAGIVPQFIEHMWDINPAVRQDGTYPPLHENGYIGSILKGLFGYNGNPSLLEIAVYVLYIAVILLIKDFARVNNLFKLVRRAFAGTD